MIKKSKSKAFLSGILLALLAFPAIAGQTFTAPGSTAAINTAGQTTLSLHASGSGTGLSFSVIGTADGKTTTLTMIPVPCSTSVTSGTANGDWIIPVSPYSSVVITLATMSNSGPEAFNWQTSTQVNNACQGVSAGGGDATAANQALQLTQETTTATGVGAPADSAYAGSGSSSIIAALKGLYTAMIAPTPAGTNAIGTVQPGNTRNTTSWLTSNGRASNTLTSSSPTACTSLQTTAGALVLIHNTGPATTVFFTLYDEGTSPTCAAADLIEGDGTTVTYGTGQILTFPIPLVNGLAYKLSGTLTSNLVIVRN